MLEKLAQRGNRVTVPRACALHNNSSESNLFSIIVFALLSHKHRLERPTGAPVDYRCWDVRCTVFCIYCIVYCGVCVTCVRIELRWTFLPEYSNTNITFTVHALILGSSFNFCPVHWEHQRTLYGQLNWITGTHLIDFADADEKQCWTRLRNCDCHFR